MAHANGFLGALLVCPALFAACSGSAIEQDAGDTGGVDAAFDASLDAGPAVQCDPRDDRGAVLFDGVDDHITMGAASGLGLATFTLEAWVRRDGPGLSTDTGVGGLRLVPIMGKGRGESDNSNLDCNYSFGFAGQVLGADFEDVASGGNHPVYGKTAIHYGEWHHVAATYDGTTWRLYLDGALDAEKVANAAPRADSIQHFALATAMTSTGSPAGRLRGAMDEARVWNRARTQEEIAADMSRELTEGEGLVARWSLDGPALGGDSLGGNPGTIIGANVETSAPISEGARPTVAVCGARK